MNVLDSSAVLALIRGEPLDADAISYFSGAVISAVNYTETVAVLGRRGSAPEDVDMMFAHTEVEIIPFDAAQARNAGRLLQQTRRWGLSLGDCACLSLTQHVNGTAITTDRIWSNLDLADVRVIR